MNEKRSLIMLLALIFFSAGCTSCGGGKSANPGGPQPQTGLPTTDVRIANSNGDSMTVSAEVATDPIQQATGMMYRSTNDDDRGMLFVFPVERVLSFWMKNTWIPLDMIFISADKRIVDINHNAVPYSEATFTSQAPAKYVLEVNGGWCDRNAVRIGDTVSFNGY